MSKKPRNSNNKCPKWASKSWTKSKPLGVWRPNPKCNNWKCKISKWKSNTFSKSNKLSLSKRKSLTGTNHCSRKDLNSISTNRCHLKFSAVLWKSLRPWKIANWLKRNLVRGKLRTSSLSWNWLNALKRSWLIKFRLWVKILLKSRNLPMKQWPRWRIFKFKTMIWCQLWWGNRCSQRIAKLMKRRQCWNQDKTRRMCLKLIWNSINRVGQSWVKFNLWKFLIVSLKSGNEEWLNDWPYLLYFIDHNFKHKYV